MRLHLVPLVLAQLRHQLRLGQVIRKKQPAIVNLSAAKVMAFPVLVVQGLRYFALLCFAG